MWPGRSDPAAPWSRFWRLLALWPLALWPLWWLVGLHFILQEACQPRPVRKKDDGLLPSRDTTLDSHGEVDEWDFTEFAVSEYEEDDDEVRASASHRLFEALGKSGA